MLISQGFRFDIQGLRAIAVLGVVLYHADKSLLPGGFVGVDIFFVISGYLITSILRGELEKGSLSIGSFYKRRALRILPALFVVLIFSMITGLIVLTPDQLEEMAKTGLSTVFFFSNFEFYRLSDYFAGEAELKPLLHTWSLSVEEQFYILFPVLLALIWKVRRSWATPIFVSVMILSLILSQWAVLQHPIAAFYLTPFRAFEFLAGAVLVGYSVRTSRTIIDAISLVGLLLIFGSMFLLREDTPFPGLIALIPCLGAAMLIFAGSSQASLGGRLISGPVMAFIGGISYSLYLWHWPILSFSKHFFWHPLSAFDTLAALSLAALVATLSWRFVERPMIRAKLSLKLIGGSLVLTSALIVGLTLIIGKKGLPSRFSPDALELLASRLDSSPYRSKCHSSAKDLISYDDSCSFGSKTANPSIAVWADSHGAEIVVALGRTLERLGYSVKQITASSCPPATEFQPARRPHCKAHNLGVLKAILHDDGLKVVIMAAAFSSYPIEQLEEFGWIVRKLHSAGKHVIVIYPIPILDFEPSVVLGFSKDRRMPIANVGITRQSFEQMNREVVKRLDRVVAQTRVVAVWPERRLCDKRLCHAYMDSVGPLYFDRRHLSLAGAQLIVEDILAVANLER